MQDQQEIIETGVGTIRKTADQSNQLKKGTANIPIVRNNLNTHMEQNQLHNTVTKQKSTGIDSMLPCPNSPNFINVDGFTEEVVGGMDGGVRKKPLTCRMGLPKGGV